MTDDNSRYEGAETALLKRALQGSGMSARQAALAMDISDTRLRHIINGYQPVGRGQRIQVVAPEDTLARIAAVLGVTADDLEDAGRGDAARQLRLRSTAFDKEEGNWMAIHQSIVEWAEDPLTMMPPADILRLFEDGELFGELERRIANLRAHVRGDARHGFYDVNAFPVASNEPLSVVDDSLDDAVAADEQEQSIAGEQELTEESP